MAIIDRILENRSVKRIKGEVFHLFHKKNQPYLIYNISQYTYNKPYICYQQQVLITFMCISSNKTNFSSLMNKV